VDEADSVVNAPVLAVPDPIGPGAAKVVPPRVVALFVPLPLTVKEDPVPKIIAAAVLVPPVSEENAELPPPGHAVHEAALEELATKQLVFAAAPETVTPLIAVAAIVPVPVTPSEPPVPTNIAAVVFVPDVI
jgi:hypothetical protein